MSALAKSTDSSATTGRAKPPRFGMRQKLALVSAFIRRPKLLILDEPFVGLDPSAAHLIKGYLSELCQNGSAVFFSTHVLEVAEKLCHQIAIIKNGKLVQSGPTAELVGDSSLENVFLEWEGDCVFEVSCIVGRRIMDIILFVGIIIYLIITAYTGYAAIEKLKGNELSEEKRIQRYWFSFLWNVASGCVVVLLIVMGPATLEETGFRSVSFLQGSHRYLAFGTWILCGLLSTVFIFQIAVFLINPSYRDSVSKQIEEKTHSGKVYDRVVNGLIPRTRREKSYFTATALAAGICEEIVFRGFLLYVLRRIFPELSPFLLAALAGVCFGAAHFYQGIKGVIKTGLLGILFGFLYISTGSLYLCMAVHFLFDISAAFLCEEDKYEV